MNKIGIFLIALATIFTFSCGGSEDENKDSSDETQEKINELVNPKIEGVFKFKDISIDNLSPEEEAMVPMIKGMLASMTVDVTSDTEFIITMSGKTDTGTYIIADDFKTVDITADSTTKTLTIVEASESTFILKIEDDGRSAEISFEK